ncbi:hypothetical protein PL10110_690019 [Planktothrix agardhii]|nr:hypothetical protein PL10110_690019 [Planktothrix agardhii]
MRQADQGEKRFAKNEEWAKGNNI